MPKFRELLNNRNFLFYSVGQAFSQFGDRLVQIVLIGFVYKRWPGSTFQLAKLFFFTVIPSFFISPIAGVYIDRWNKKYVMILSDTFRALAILLIPVFFIYSENIIPIYIIIFFTFASACFFLPAKLSIIPSLVSKEELLIANSASSITWVGAGILGFTLGGFLAEWVGLRNSLYLNAVVYFFSAASFVFLGYSVRKRTESDKLSQKIKPTEIIKESFLRDFKEGIKTLLSDKKVKFVLYVFFTLFSMIGAIYVVAVVFIQETLKTMTRDVGLFSMCIFTGLMLGSFIYGKVGQKMPRSKTVLISIFLTGISIVLFAAGLRIARSVLLGGASICLLGFFIAPVYVTATTIVHESIESRLGGRIFSSMGIVMNMGFLLFMFISSVVAEFVDRFWILIICGIGFAFFGLIGVLVGFLKKLTFSSS